MYEKVEHLMKQKGVTPLIYKTNILRTRCSSTDKASHLQEMTCAVYGNHSKRALTLTVLPYIHYGIHTERERKGQAFQ